MTQPRPNMNRPRPVNVIDLQMYRQHGFEFTDNARVKYGVDWSRALIWSSGLVFGVAVWLGVYLLALYVVG